MSDELDNKEDAALTEAGTESAVEDTEKIAKESDVAVDAPIIDKESDVAIDTPTIAKEEVGVVQTVENAQSEKEPPDSTANTESTKDQDKDPIEEVKEPTKSSVTSSAETVVPDAPTENEKQSDDPVPQSISEDTNAKSVEPVETSQANKSGEDTPKSSNPTTQDAASVGPEIDENSEHLTYKDDGTVIFTDPKTHYQYKWCSETDKWVAQDVTLENEFYKWCPVTNQWLPKETATETEHYKWDAEKCEWVVKEVVAAAPTATVDEEGRRIYTDKDGAVFFWDTEKKAWFPKIDDDFMARYQMNYGFIDNTSAGEAEQRLKAETEEKRKAEELQRMTAEAKQADDNDEKKDAGEATGAPNGGKRKAKQEPPKWFDLNPEQNTKVYVSNLPLDITLDEFAELMSKCGMIMRDPKTQKYKLKLYSEPDGQLKGDGLCDYIKVESVGLAIKILDEYNYRGHKIHVQRAQFQMRGEYNPALKPKRKKSDKEKLQKIKEKLFDWRPEKMRGERSKNEKIVIIKNLFSPELFEKEVQLILDYQNDLRDECSKCGTVRKVVIYDRHPEGVAQVNMSSPEDADIVIQMMNGRFFGKRKLIAEHWDGKTKYKIAESETEAQKRLAEWDKFLIEEEAKFEQIERSGQREAPQPIAEQERAEEAALTAQLESEMHAEEGDD